MSTNSTPPTSADGPCRHMPPCPPADAADRDSALLVAHHPEQGWSRLCNGVLLFEDTGELLPDGQIVEPHRGHIVTAAAR
ncbi:DUF5999 family protein [Streptomyces sp. NPDC059611]|uniref:DUF5999 family protein n=1 Tax=Streptomyces sp. NPDC059611 TaxID=3346884 RepID=UPI00369FC63E